MRFLKNLLAAAVLSCLLASTAHAARIPFGAAALTNTAVAVNPGYTNLSFMQCYNPNGAQTYVQLFNATTANTTVGTTPSVAITIAAAATGGFALADQGITFTTALSVAATTTANGNTAPATAITCTFGYN